MITVKLSNEPQAKALEAIISILKSKVKVEKAEKIAMELSKDITIDSPSAIARHLAGLEPSLHLYESDIITRTQIDHWLEFANLAVRDEQKFVQNISYLNSHLVMASYLVGEEITLADIFLFIALKDAPLFQKMVEENKAPCHLARYYKFLSGHEALKNIASEDFKTKNIQCAAASQETASKKERKTEGKFIDLPGAEMGKVVVRFPPEASGYLHIGHAKASLLNQYYQQSFDGKLILRFDDTNPEKESDEFEKVILEDVSLLGIKPDVFTRTSDHFDRIIELCNEMIKGGRAYADDTDPEVMKKEREERAESKNRNNSVEKNMSMWQEMQKGTEYGLKCCIRAKLDMASDNGCLRDPTMYRCKVEEHVVTGNKYKVYPTYDFACPIVDSVEGVTHALRTMEYHDRDEQYYWFIDALGLRKPVIWEYSRLNLMNTVMSKRKLTWLVNENVVEGWDDPRFPTVRGVMRRGMTVQGLKEFVIAQGSSRATTTMEWDKIWAFNKKVIDPIAPRYVALQKDSVVPVIVRDAVNEVKEVQKHPKEASVGMKEIWYGPTVLIEGADAAELSCNETVTFINWGNLTIEDIKKDESGKIVSVYAKLNLENKDFKNTQKLTWLPDIEQASLTPTVCVSFEHIISKPVLGKDEDFKAHINRNSKVDMTMLGDPELKKLKKGDIIQLQRRGFFICDSPYELPSRHSGREQPCVLFNIPDGHTKEMPTAGSKVKSRNEKKHQTADAKAPSVAEVKTNLSQAAKGGEDLDKAIVEQGDRIRQLKCSKATKEELEPHVKKLLDLKKQYKDATGQEWKPNANPAVQKEKKVSEPIQTKKAEPATGGAPGVKSSAEALKLNEAIVEQGGLVRQLKTDKAPKEEVDRNVARLLELKKEFQTLTGQAWNPSTSAVKNEVQSSKGEGAPSKQLKGAAVQSEATAGKRSNGQKTKGGDKPAKPETVGVSDDGKASREVKKVTREGMEVRKEENFSEWYTQVLKKAEMIEYHNVSGCYVIRSWAFKIWEVIQSWFDAEIEKIGFENCYFPMFVSQGALETEKEHIADFAPEVAWVTRAGSTELDEPIAIRPTSETVMYPYYAKWVQSYNDLPLKYNQWCNVVRWEFKHPTPFLRTREFLWQEGHSAHNNYPDAEEEVYHILDLYSKVYEELLAVPVIKGRKTEKEKFPGGDYTTTIEAYIPGSGRGIQAATSHHLGKNFSKMFDISFQDEDTGKKEFAFQNSWGLTTRTIGVVVMVHGDDKGLVLPPRVARLQVVIVPCGITAQLKEDERQKLMSECKNAADLLKKVNVRVNVDGRNRYSPGWKFNHWELKGVPIRIEIGPKDLKSSQFVAVRRDTGAKTTLKMSELTTSVPALLEDIQRDMLQRAKNTRDSNIATCFDFSDVCLNLNDNKLIVAPFCGEPSCEDEIKKLSTRDSSLADSGAVMGAKSLCIPFEQPAPMKRDDRCIGPGCCSAPKMYTLFGRSY